MKKYRVLSVLAFGAGALLVMLAIRRGYLLGDYQRALVHAPLAAIEIVLAVHWWKLANEQARETIGLARRDRR